MNLIKEHRYFILFYGFLFMGFFWPMIFCQKTFLHGDYSVQYYPWMQCYAEMIKQGRLPYWTNLIASGFPLVAEGQIGAYYFFHLVFYTLFSFERAYDLSIYCPFVIGGIGCYLFGKKIGLAKEGAALCAVIFSFSSAYGGCFYTTAGMRGMAWFPWGLWAIEYLRDTGGKGKIYWTLILGVFISQIGTAGFPQLAIYALLYFFLYILCRENRFSQITAFASACVVGFLLALPQIIPTLELARESVRAGEGLSFSLWGSVLPPAFISLVFPEWGALLRMSFYIGALPLLLFLWSMVSKPNRYERVFILLTVLFALLSLGKYNPLYVFAIETGHLTFLRNPSKFLFFSVVSMGLVSGFGLDRLLKKSDQENRRKTGKPVLVFVCLIFLAPFIISWFCQSQRSRLESVALDYSNQHYADIREPMHERSYYAQKTYDILCQFQKTVSPSSPRNWTVFFLFGSGLALIYYGTKTEWSKPALKYLAAGLIAADLFAFGHSFGGGFVGNLREKKEIRCEWLSQAIRSDGPSPPSVIEWVDTADKELLTPCSNMLYGIPHPGGYSPLYLKRYYELTKDLGISDCALGRREFSEKTWLDQRKIINLLGVGLVLSDRKLSVPDFEFYKIASQALIKDGKRQEMRRYFYKNLQAFPGIFGIYDWQIRSRPEERLRVMKSENFDPGVSAVAESAREGVASAAGKSYARPLLVEPYGKNGLAAKFKLEGDAFVVARIAYYPHWRAWVDGNPEKVVPADHAFCGVFVKKGGHEIRFDYDESFHRRLELLSLAGWILVVILVIFNRRAA